MMLRRGALSSQLGRMPPRFKTTETEKCYFLYFVQKKDLNFEMYIEIWRWPPHLNVSAPPPFLTIEQPNFRTTSVDDIRQKLADKKEKQLVELRRIEDDIAAGRLQRPLVGQALGQPIPSEFS